MKKQLIVAAILVFVVGTAVLGVGYLRNSQEARQQNNAANATSKENTESSDTETMVAQSEAKDGTYTAYSQAALESTSGTKLLFFHAPWCPQCRMIEYDIEAAKLPAGVTIFKVDYDSNQDLRQQYGVTLQTTFIRLDDKNELAEKYVAYNEPTLDSVLKNVLQ